METTPAAPRPLHIIAGDIMLNWTNVYFGAVPYLNAMLNLNSINDKYGEDQGKHIVNYFLSNAATFRGPEAKRLKAELKSLLK